MAETIAPLFGLVPSETDPNADEFWVKVDITVTSMGARLPTSGTTTYSAFDMTHSGPERSDYGTWVYSRRTLGDAPGTFLFWFARAASGTALVGNSYLPADPSPPEKYLTSRTIRSTKQNVVTGSAPPTTSDIIKAEIAPLDGLRSLLNKDALISYSGAALEGWELDPETGKGSPVIEQAVVAGTQGSSEIAADATFSTITPVNAFWSIKTTKKTTTLSNVPLVWTNTEKSPVLWPAVLVSPVKLWTLHTSTDYFYEDLFYTLIKAYSGDVKVTYSEWWQKSAPSPQEPTEMLDTAIEIPRTWAPSISIPSCLHPAFSITEARIIGYSTAQYTYATASLNDVTITVPATNVEEWPATVTKLDVERYQGGFRCIKRVIEKPQSTVTGLAVSVGDYVNNGLTRSNYAP